MNEEQIDVRPYAYYTVMRQAQDPKALRLRMAVHARQHGIKPTAEAFKTTPKTVRKWLGRFDGKLDSLNELSRAPHKRPRKLTQAAENKILDAKRAATRFGARRLELEFTLPYSLKAIARVCREHGLDRKYRRRKHQTKRLLREVKKHWRLFQQIDIDTRNLCDIPEYWQPLKQLRLPRQGQPLPVLLQPRTKKLRQGKPNALGTDPTEKPRRRPNATTTVRRVPRQTTSSTASPRGRRGVRCLGTSLTWNSISLHRPPP